MKITDTTRIVCGNCRVFRVKGRVVLRHVGDSRCRARHSA